MKAGIAKDLIEEALQQISDEDEEGNAYEVAKRLVKGLSAQSQNVMRQTLIHKLVKKVTPWKLPHGLINPLN